MFLCCVPYSGVFLFWGIILQIILWYLSHGYERVNKPIVGLPLILPKFQDFISLEFVQIISPNMHDPVELDLIVLKEKELSSPEWSEFLMQCFLNSIVVEEHSNLIEKLSRQVDLGQFSFRKSLQLVRENKYLPIKRAIDISVSMVLLIAFLPVFVLISMLLRLESRGANILATESWNGWTAIHHLQVRTMRTTRPVIEICRRRTLALQKLANCSKSSD